MKKKKKHGKVLSTLIILFAILLCGAGLAALEYSEFFSEESLALEDTQTASPSATDTLVSETELPAETEAVETTETADATTESAEAESTLPVYAASENRVTYQDGFYYEPVSDNTELMERIRNLSYNESINTTVTFDMLSYVRVRYIDFNDTEQEGELVCSTSIAQDLVEIFYELYQARYQIASIRLVDDFNADDTASLEANNTSAFNYRMITGTTDQLSSHAYGTAVDINPLYNPYVSTDADGNTTILPSAGAAYADRTQNLAHMIDEDDLCYQLFTAHGFTWGGSWTSVKDYQHFQKDTSE